MEEHFIIWEEGIRKAIKDTVNCGFKDKHRLMTRLKILVYIWVDRISKSEGAAFQGQCRAWQQPGSSDSLGLQSHVF